MQIHKTKLNYNPSRDVYWAKVNLQSEENKKTTSVFFCVSHQYLGEKINLSSIDDKKATTWYENAIHEWEKKGEDLFRREYHYDVRAVTSEGESKGLKFLKEELATV